MRAVEERAKHSSSLKDLKPRDCRASVYICSLLFVQARLVSMTIQDDDVGFGR